MSKTDESESILRSFQHKPRVSMNETTDQERDLAIYGSAESHESETKRHTWMRSGSNLSVGEEGAAEAPERTQGTASQRASRKLSLQLEAFEIKELVVERGSVYGAAVLMPQVARSANWSPMFTSLMISTYVYLGLCIILHACLLFYIVKEYKFWQPYKAKPYMCDTGARMDCGDEDCIGVGGTKITPPRRYNWDQFHTRTFARDALRDLFPSKSRFVEEFADPGEYALESFVCRCASILVFFAAIVSEIWLCFDLARLLWFTPNYAESWLELDDRTAECLVHKSAERDYMNHVRVQVAGMSPVWKIINAVFVLFPKVMLVVLTGSSGVTFLMEAAAIDDLIVNSCALAFLMKMDEIITASLMSESANRLLDHCDSYEYYQLPSEVNKALTLTMMGTVYDVIFVQLWKFFAVLVFSCGYMFIYYLHHCDRVDGHFVSRAMFQVKSADWSMFSWAQSFFFPLQVDDEAVWEMHH